MSSVEVMLVSGTGMFSGLIRWWGGGYFAHMAAILPDGTVLDSQDSAMTIGGVHYPAGVHTRPAGYLDSEPQWVKITIPCTDAQALAWQRALKSQLGKPYDWTAIYDFADGSLQDRNWRDQSAWICSELQVWALEQAGICPALLLPAYRVTPGDGSIVAQACGGQVIASRGLGELLAA